MKRKYSTAAELRTQARDALRNRWVIAVVAFLIIGIFGTGFGGGSATGGGDYDSNPTAYNENMMSLENNVTEYVEDGDIAGAIEYVLTDSFASALIVVGLAVTVVSLIYGVFVGTPLTAGYSRFNLDLYKKREEPSLNTLFYAFRNCYWKSIGVALLESLILGGIFLAGVAAYTLLVLLGALTGLAFFVAFAVLLGYIVLMVAIVLLIVKALDYAMVNYILVDQDGLRVSEILAKSKKLMNGHKWRYFCMILSFFGWILLALVFTLGLGLFVVGAYIGATEAAFYRELARGGKKQNFLVKLFSKN